jgi:hypothetical protein
MKFVYRPGFNFPVAADQAATALEQIRMKTILTAPAIVKASRPKSAPLHPIFNWNDADAAEKYREGQARTLVRAIKVVQPTGERAPVYVSVNPTGGATTGYYQRASVAVSRPDEWASAVAMLAMKVASAESAIEELRRMADRSGNETAGLLVIAANALAAAREAVGQIRH